MKNPHGKTISKKELERLLVRAGRNEAQRTCLKCGETFLSVSKANRICEKCHTQIENSPVEYSSESRSEHKIQLSEKHHHGGFDINYDT